MIIRRKTFAENEGSGMGKKLLKGAAVVAGTAGAVYGAKKGMFGTGAQMGVNKGIMKAGKALGSDKMILSGAQDYGRGAAKKAANMALKNKGVTMTSETVSKLADKKAMNAIARTLK